MACLTPPTELISTAPNELVILSMAANPHPNKVRLAFDCERSVVQTNAHGPKTSDLFEVQRGMSWVVS